MRTAEQIGDPQALLNAYNDILNRVARLEARLPEAQAGQALLDGKTSQQVYELRTRGTPEEREILKAWYQVVMEARTAVRYGLEYMQRAGAQYLFWSILQQYRLEPKLRKKIETAAKYFSKTRHNRPEDLTVLSVYQKLVDSWRAMGAAAAQALQEGQRRDEMAADDVLTAGPFRVVDTGGFEPAVLAATAKVIESAASAITAKGLDRVCYGDIHLSRTVNRQNVLAFYLSGKDELFVRANLKGQETAAIKTIIHELGHRWDHKYLTKVQVGDLYRAVSRLESEGHSERIKAMMPKAGETVTIKGQTYTVTGVESTRAGLKVMLDYPGGKARIALEGYAQHKGTRVPLNGFVTEYARTNPAENFAEMFAFYVLDRLTPEQTALLLPLLK